jgi:hypothetical protein
MPLNINPSSRSLDATAPAFQGCSIVDAQAERAVETPASSLAPAPVAAQAKAPPADSGPLSRRPVPLTFSPIINDEANILSAIARGESAIPDMAERYKTTVTAFCLWL